MQCATGVAGSTLTGIRRGGCLALGGGASAGAGVTLFVVAICRVGTAGGGDATLGGGAVVGGRSTLGGGITYGGGTTLGSGGGSGGWYGEVLGTPAKDIGVGRGGGAVYLFQFLKISRSLVIAVSCSLCILAEVSFTK